MNLDFFILGGYEKFVWTAFIFTFTICLYLFIKTKKELKEQEKIFLSKFKKLHETEVLVEKKRVIVAEVSSGSKI